MTAGDNFLQYMAGWYCGAGYRPLDAKRSEHADKAFAKLYLDGWDDGRKAAREARAAASKRFDYNPSIIRAA